MEGSDGPRDTDDALDVPELEGRLLRDDDPRYPIDVDDIADACLGTVQVLNAILAIRPPQHELVCRHLPVAPVVEADRGVPAEDLLSIRLIRLFTVAGSRRRCAASSAGTNADET